MNSITFSETSNTTNAQFYEDEQNNKVDGQYVVTIRDGEILEVEPVGESTVVDAEAYWRLRKDLNAAQKIITELANRMRFIHDERSIAEFDYPIHEVATR
ncbi:hypothetical protein ID856_11960 [Xenorhabdus sp. 18]|uniref:hypothetical protein n=1 Tax=Xenorhabdus doucetiae TaxID=351671 RepID=UPI0019BD1653|nr:hypothetical protein [Xenorhabdus sp. 18]MBD2797247.1 hypothetical protein [Xenorhabdus sp. 18]